MLNNETVARELLIKKIGENELITDNEQLLNVLSKYYDKTDNKIIDEVKNLLLMNKTNFKEEDNNRIILYYIDSLLTKEEIEKVSRQYISTTIGIFDLHEVTEKFEDNFNKINGENIDEIIDLDSKLLDSETYKNSKYHQLITEIEKNLFIYDNISLKIFLYKLYNKNSRYDYVITNELYKKMKEDYNRLSNAKNLSDNEIKILKDIRIYHKLFDSELDDTDLDTKDYSKFLIEFNLSVHLKNKMVFNNFEGFDEKESLVREEYEKENKTYYIDLDNFIIKFNEKYPNINFNILKSNDFVKLDKEILYLILDAKSKKHFTELEIRNLENDNNYSFIENYKKFEKNNEYKKEIESKYKEKLEEIKNLGKYSDISINYYRNLILNLQDSEESIELRRYSNWYNNNHKDYFDNDKEISVLDYYDKLIENLKNKETVTPLNLGPITLKYERYFADVLGRDSKALPTIKKLELRKKLKEVAREKSNKYAVDTRLYILKHYKETLLSGENFFENIDESIDIRIINFLLSDCFEIKDYEKILGKIKTDNDQNKTKKRLEQKLPEHLDIVKKLINDYNCSKKDFLEHESVNENTLTIAIKNVKEKAPEIYEQLNNARKQAKSQQFAKVMGNISEINKHIQNGYIEEDNEVHVFELLDYYKHTRLEPDEFLDLIHKGQKRITPDQNKKLNNFFGKTKKIYLNRNDELEDKLIIIIEGKEHEVTTEEKQEAFAYLDNNNIPNYPKLYKQALKRILNQKTANKQLKK